MDLKTQTSATKKTKVDKCAESLTTSIYQSGAKCDQCNEESEKLFQKILESKTLDRQIQDLKQIIHTLATSTSSSTGHVQTCHQVEQIVFWYFSLDSGSALKSVIAKSVTRLTEQNVFEEAFKTHLKSIIDQVDHDLVSFVQRCFENCDPAFEAVKSNICQLYEIFTNQCKNETNIDNLGPLARVLLSLETISRSPNLSLIEVICDFFLDGSIPGDAKSNFCLLWIHETCHHFAQDHFSRVVQGLEKNVQDKNEIVVMMIQMPRISSWILYMANAIVTLSSNSDLFEMFDQQCQGLELLFDVITSKHQEKYVVFLIFK
jgi:hypothetical protein